MAPCTAFCALLQDPVLLPSLLPSYLTQWLTEINLILLLLLTLDTGFHSDPISDYQPEIGEVWGCHYRELPDRTSFAQIGLKRPNRLWPQVADNVRRSWGSIWFVELTEKLNREDGTNQYRCRAQGSRKVTAPRRERVRKCLNKHPELVWLLSHCH